jgi:hypothetical protein
VGTKDDMMQVIAASIRKAANLEVRSKRVSNGTLQQKLRKGTNVVNTIIVNPNWQYQVIVLAT